MSLWPYVNEWVPEQPFNMPGMTSNSVEFISEPYMENPYPPQPDDGTWEGEGGYVSRPDYDMFVIDDPMFWGSGKKIIVHPLTYAEIEHSIGREK